MGTIPHFTATLRTGERVRIRAAEAGDAPASRALALTLTGEEPAWLAAPDEVMPEDDLRRDIERHASSTNSLWLVAFGAGDAFVGGARCQGHAKRRAVHRGTIGIGVAPTHRGVGLGRALLGAIIDWARAHPTLEKLDLGVFADNRRAIRLYESLGFAHEGLRVREARLGQGRYRDECLMGLWLGEKGWDAETRE